MDLIANILISAMIAATPLVFAATGELVAERSGVLNLGVEGMMIIGAIAGFAAVLASGSHLIAIGAAMTGGAVMAALLGAYLFGGITILQLHSQAFGVKVDAQLLSTLPYLATIAVLVIISRDSMKVKLTAPACLGRPFHAAT